MRVFSHKSSWIGVVLALSLQGQTTDQESLTHALARALDWSSFWNPGDIPDKYAAGKHVTATVIDHGQTVTVFIEHLGIAISFSRNREGAIRGGTLRPIQEPRQSAVEKLIRSSQPGSFVLRSDAPRIEVRGAERLSRKILVQPKIFDIGIDLPALEMPPAVANHTIPSGVEEFIGFALRRAKTFQQAGCRPLILDIPFYAPDDPEVYVLVDLGTDCERGVIPFVSGNDGWSAGQFSPTTPSNEWRRTIDKIQRNKLGQVKLY